MVFESLKKSVEDFIKNKTNEIKDNFDSAKESFIPKDIKEKTTSETKEDWEKIREKMQNMSHEEFTEISQDKRLALITKSRNNFSEIKNGKTKELTFQFSFNGKVNKDLQEFVTLGQVFPNEISEVSQNGKKYKRSGFEGEFFNEKGERLLILDKTKIEISKIRNPEEMKQIKEKNENYFQEFLKLNPTYNKEEYFEIIKESIKNGLLNEEILIILSGSYEKIPLLGLESGKKILNTIKYLKNQGLLDYSDAKENIEDIIIVIELLKKYGSKDLKYNISEKEDNGKKMKDLKFDEKSFENEPKSLQKIIDVALSQVGITEANRGADKYFSEAGFGNLNSKAVPWCAAFINWVLMKAGYPGTKSLAAKSFIKESGFGHVAIKVGDKMVGGNQGNKVSVANISRTISGYAIPTENGLEIKKGNFNKKDIPDGAIIVMGRNPKSRKFR